MVVILPSLVGNDYSLSRLIVALVTHIVCNTTDNIFMFFFALPRNSGGLMQREKLLSSQNKAPGANISDNIQNQGDKD